MSTDDRNTLRVLGEHNKASGSEPPNSQVPEVWVYPSRKKNPITDTLRVAKAFGKAHKAVLRAFDNLACDDNFSRNNFAPSEYTDKRGKTHRVILLTRQGFAFLVMGFTGQKAAQFKQLYIEQFDLLEAQLGTHPVQAPIPLVQFTQRGAQVACTKGAASQLLRTKAGKNALIQHHRGVMRALVGKTPTEYVRAAVASGLRVASCSGRELLRRLDPAKAATAAFLDDQLNRGKTLEQLTSAGVPHALTAAFDAMLRCGITPAEFHAA